jgi:hypothetical protein
LVILVLQLKQIGVLKYVSVFLLAVPIFISRVSVKQGVTENTVRMDVHSLCLDYIEWWKWRPRDVQKQLQVQHIASELGKSAVEGIMGLLLTHQPWSRNLPYWTSVSHYGDRTRMVCHQ